MKSKWNNPLVEEALERIRLATVGTHFESRLYLVGGALRDRELGLPHGTDLDLVLEANAGALAHFLYQNKLSTHFPVEYPRFGTAMIHIAVGDAGVDVELVTARKESYSADSRKPDVQAGSLEEDIYRRDFTINTLAENIHSFELFDITGRALSDLKSGVVRTPVEPTITFFDDPLRMLRAIRFAARFDFTIEDLTWNAIKQECSRLAPPTVSMERVRDEFIKIAMLPGKRFRRGMELLVESGLLWTFMTEMQAMIGCTQGSWHRYDVWEHTLTALEALPDEAPLDVRLGLLWHDIGKPATRSEPTDGRGTRFYGHAAAGATITRNIMNRLKFSNDDIASVTVLVDKHMRLGEYRSEWEDPAVKRLIRDTRGHLDQLFTITRCDRSAVNIPEGSASNLEGMRARIDTLIDAVTIESPLNGNEIMDILNVKEGPHLKEAKDLLVNAIIDGKLNQGDKTTAAELLRNWKQSKAQ